MTETTLPTNDPALSRAHRAIIAIGNYFGAYILGIIACIAITPVELTLINVPLWMYYPILAIPGYVAGYVLLSVGYLPLGGVGLGYWAMFLVGLVPIVMGVVNFYLRRPLIKALRPLWIGFPIGFAGTLGVYYIAASGV